MKRIVYERLHEPDRRTARQLESRLFAWTAGQEDAPEGPMAFLEKRAPQWRLAKNSDFPEDLFSGTELERPGP